MSRIPYDPRYDLVEDSELWMMVLKTAEKIDEETYNALHYTRCCGARLYFEPSRQDQKLYMQPQFGKHEFKDQEEWNEHRRICLIPYSQHIMTIFKTVENFLLKQQKNAS